MHEGARAGFGKPWKGAEALRPSRLPAPPGQVMGAVSSFADGLEMGFVLPREPVSPGLLLAQCRRGSPTSTIYQRAILGKPRKEGVPLPWSLFFALLPLSTW